MNEREFAELAAGHALHALSETDERAFQVARDAHPEWEHLVRADADVADALAAATPPVMPPPSARAAILARIAETPQSRPTVPPPPSAQADPPGADRRKRSLSRRGVFALAASVLLVLAIGLGALVATQQQVRPAAVVALEQIEQAPDAQSATASLADGGEATVHWSDSLGQSVIVANGFPALPEDRTFELWFVRGDTPIPAGTFAVDDSGEAVALLDGQQRAGDVIAVTIEPAGGSPDGLPTTDPIVAIPT